jgi:hypothetical protein
VQPLAAQIGWTHHQVLLDAFGDGPNLYAWYAAKAVENRWSRRQLRGQICGRPRVVPGLRSAAIRPPGSPFMSIGYGERLAEIGATPSIGTVGDSYDNALAETVNGYYKAELIRGPARQGPWKTVEEVELATLGWVHWQTPSACTATSETCRPSSSSSCTPPEPPSRTQIRGTYRSNRSPAERQIASQSVDSRPDRYRPPRIGVSSPPRSPPRPSPPASRRVSLAALGISRNPSA